MGLSSACRLRRDYGLTYNGGYQALHVCVELTPLASHRRGCIFLMYQPLYVQFAFPTLGMRYAFLLMLPSEPRQHQVRIALLYPYEPSQGTLSAILHRGPRPPAKGLRPHDDPQTHPWILASVLRHQNNTPAQSHILLDRPPKRKDDMDQRKREPRKMQCESPSNCRLNLASIWSFAVPLPY
jgi:hypothetical protein